MTGTSRRDSETSRASDDSHSAEKDSRPPAKEERKMVPAPPPKENAWSRPRSDAGGRPAEPARQVSEGWPMPSGFGDFNSGVCHVVKSMTAGSNPKIGLLTGALLNIVA